MLGLTFSFGLLYYLMGLLFIIASSFGISMFGLLMNLLFPKLEYENEQEVIKQSLAAFLGVMVPMMAGMGMMVFFFTCMDQFPYLFELILLVYIIIDVIQYLLLMKQGTKKFEALI